MNKPSYFLIYFLIVFLMISTVIVLLSTSGIFKNKIFDVVDVKLTQEESVNQRFLFEGAYQKYLTVVIKDKATSIDIVDIDTSKIPTGIGISSPDVFQQGNGKYAGLTLNEYADLGNFKIVQSGGFLSSWTPPYPLGYVKIRGKEYNRAHISWLTEGTFCTNGRKFEIGKFESVEKLGPWISCIQSGPLIIKNKQVVLNTNRNTGFVTKESHRQSFMCKKINGHLLLGIAEDVKLIDLSNWMAQSDEEGGLACVDAVLLTSKGISGMLIKSPNGNESIGNTDVPIPNAIIVK